MIRSDNGLEFTLNDFEIWCNERKYNFKLFDQANNRLFREAVLNASLFFDLAQGRSKNTTNEGHMKD